MISAVKCALYIKLSHRSVTCLILLWVFLCRVGGAKSRDFCIQVCIVHNLKLSHRSVTCLILLWVFLCRVGGAKSRDFCIQVCIVHKIVS